MRQTDAEAVPWRCHRSLITDALIVRGNWDKHLVNGRTFRVHSLTSFGRTRHGGIDQEGIKKDKQHRCGTTDS
jgi:hypothetical protein